MRALILLAVLFCGGCITPMVRLDNAKRLMARPDAQAARQAAPGWCEDALKTINALELERERK